MTPLPPAGSRPYASHPFAENLDREPHLADTPEQALSYSGPQVTTGGVLCGRCTDVRVEAGDPMRVYHASVAHVRACDDAYHSCMAEGAAEARNPYL